MQFYYIHKFKLCLFPLLTALPTEPKPECCQCPCPRFLLCPGWVEEGIPLIGRKDKNPLPTSRRLAGRRAEGVWRRRARLALSVVLVRPEHTHAEQTAPSLGVESTPSFLTTLPLLPKSTLGVGSAGQELGI